VRNTENYYEFIASKRKSVVSYGFDVDINELNPLAFEWQKKIVRWALKKGRANLFEDCGLGKTLQQLMFANEVCKHTGGSVIIFAPLAVCVQTQREGVKFGYEVNICRTQKDVIPGINITNYEMAEHFNADVFDGIILDESSILKQNFGKTRELLTEKFKNTKYKLCCTATPAPNDYVEIGNHAEFLGIMTRLEMLSTFFTHDGGNTSKWKIKGHAKEEFFKWLADFSCCITSPADLGYPAAEYELPNLNIIEIVVKSNDLEDCDGQRMLVPLTAMDLNERRNARRQTLFDRVAKAAEIANACDSQVLVWCDLNDESKELTNQIDNAVEVTGSDTDEHKQNAMFDFTNGNIKCLVSKPKIAGWGMNWQNCHNVIFVGLSDSFESYYQAIRRCWRFGQTSEVNVYIITSDKESCVKQNIETKQAKAQTLTKELACLTRDIVINEMNGKIYKTSNYLPNEDMKIPQWIGE
jgi:hypothetical protein